MYVYKFTVKASQDRPNGCPLSDTSEHYIAAYSYDQAYNHVVKNLSNACWKIEDISERLIYVKDIRDSCDHTTDD